MASSPAADKILLKGGTLLAHEGANVQVLKGYDLLIEGKEIRKIARGITPPPGARVVDCTNKIVSPGFIDTHHHLWQSQVRLGLFCLFICRILELPIICLIFNTYICFFLDINI